MTIWKNLTIIWLFLLNELWLVRCLGCRANWKKWFNKGGYFVGGQRFYAAQRRLLLKREYAYVISVIRNILQNLKFIYMDWHTKEGKWLIPFYFDYIYFAINPFPDHSAHSLAGIPIPRIQSACLMIGLHIKIVLQIISGVAPLVTILIMMVM